MKHNRDNSPSTTVNIKYKTETEIPILKKNAKVAKNTSDYLRVISLKAKCECGRNFYQP